MFFTPVQWRNGRLRVRASLAGLGIGGYPLAALGSEDCSDGDSDRSAGDPVWGSAALEDEWRAASLARQAVGDAAYAAAHAAGASRAEACDAAVRAVRLDEVEAQSSFLDWEGEERPEEYAGLFDDP
ncbi:hypothetical protein EMIHUDRAFT_207945 [Emiliania huxleyi CCMP1516]|uniref:Uncharacterized protein n=2 Tax=Emiliania huxleyi TaxID=2903 RepID=A0A0D3JBN6_EMIH1|nr:hypothetical protein EMIHUDRAFT_207945 [Emiliania huxleyi CCMP1516]EOD20921.1 hypothetical protein EMIHUDRAFT_207945 [Emiliania huxleyi CCMP1516]|eukprot:XP_005773350.1 hypothetical protein EMIHUDRAFT_207945 [Emiliania huxleyi CCMP1516]